MSDDQFCDECGVSFDLHPYPYADDPADRGCDTAEMKAHALDQFFGAFR